MKKWIGALCSGLAGVLSLVFLAIPVFTVDMGAFGKENYSGWNMLTDKMWKEMDLTAITWYRIFAGVLVVLAIVLILVAVLQVLANLNVVKVPAIVNTVAKYALIALAVVSILALVANFGVRAEVVDMVGSKKPYSVGAGLWIVAIVNVVAAVCANLFKKAE